MTVIVITKDLGTGYRPPERFKASFVKHTAGKINYMEVYRSTMRIRKKGKHTARRINYCHW
jgi:hypothetical protein